MNKTVIYREMRDIIFFFWLVGLQQNQMKQNIHNQLIYHYKTRKTIQNAKMRKVQSVIRQTFIKKPHQQDHQSSYNDFLRNQSHVAPEVEPLDFRQLPRNLKVYFPGPPKPPSKLEEIPYTYEIVQNVPYKQPKQKKGQIGEWVLQQSGFIQRKVKSVSEHKRIQKVYQMQKDLTQTRTVFRRAIKTLASRMKENNLSFKEIQKNKGLIKKSYNFYNSKDFFSLIKNGQNQAEGLLDINPHLAFDIDEFKMTALHWAARQGHAYLTKILLQQYRANTASKDMYGRTPLHLAVAKKQTPCIIRIFVQGGHLNALDNQKRNVKVVAPDSYTRYLLQKLQEVKFIIRAKGFRDLKLYKSQLQKHIKYILDQSSLYF